MNPSAPERYKNFEEFWPFYLSEHAVPATRMLHIVGTGIALILVLLGVLSFSLLTILLGVLVGYGLAWCAHAAIEKNTPATFSYPLWSLLGDLKMFWLFIALKLEPELQRHNISHPRKNS